MADWLFKEEPSNYSFAQLMQEGRTTWDGVANPLARKHLRSVQVGDRVLFYATGTVKAIVGEMRVTRGPQAPADDPNAVSVQVEAVANYPAGLTLARLKQDATLADWELLRLPRLSVMPVSAAQWKRVQELREELAGAELGRSPKQT
ncbi:MAG: EVE domain-containing protein [Gemmataceae bacterium]